ncbi:ATP-binding cassette domain-containing protein [Actinomyces sp. ZJ308]|uniref:ATP-binding cassette domain-containing protein n=1 Tax=Actinomyces sp. ZJ308 TaxID=2708342 RepID=UPI00142311ED|nr:ATP-binding cassette domain-containing protein [Actinomyces sp. ZJ308]
MPAISFSRVSFSHTSEPLLENISLTVCDGERVCVVGPNGSGKSTLLRLATGELSADRGIVTVLENCVPPVADPSESINAYLDAACGEPLNALDRLEVLNEAIAKAGPVPGSLVEEYDSLLVRLETLDAWNLPTRRAEALAGLGLKRVSTDRPVSSLSPGQRGRLEIAALLLSAGQALVLDEPTNHLDADGSDYLGRMMTQWPGPVLFTSHDRAFIDTVATAVVDLDTAPWQALATAAGDGEAIGAYRCAGRYSDYLVDKANARASHRSLHQRQQAQRRSLTRHRQESKTVGHRGAAPRTEVRMARKFCADRAQRVSTRRQAQDDRRLEALAETEVRRPRSYGLQLRLAAPVSPRGMAVSARAAAVPGRLAPVTVDVMAGEHLLITGANGAGKSTFLTWLATGTAPAEGSCGTLTVSGSVFRVPQHLPEPGDPGIDESVWTGGVGEQGKGILHPQLWNRPISELSDGNQRRAQLALAAAAVPEVLAIDEPTNYLDLDALEMLETALKSWTGTLIVASHDRWLISHWWGRRLHLG